MAGLKIEIHNNNENPELTVNYQLDLPKALSNPSLMFPVINYLTGSTNDLPEATQEALKKTKTQLFNTLGQDTEGAGIIIETLKNNLLREYQHDPRYAQKIRELYEDPLISDLSTFVFESVKNTYDSVIVLNYLASLQASLTPEEFRAKEPLVYQAMQENGITRLSPVEQLSFSCHAQSNENQSTLTMTDNGAGKLLVDAFKMQHSSNHRNRLKISGRLNLSEARKLNNTPNLDDLYDDSQGHFHELGLRTGGHGKGARIEQKLLESIGATSEFSSENQTGIHLTLTRLKSPTLAMSPLSEELEELEEPEIPIRITETESLDSNSDSEAEETPIIKIISDNDPDSDSEDSELEDNENQEKLKSPESHATSNPVSAKKNNFSLPPSTGPY